MIHIGKSDQSKVSFDLATLIDTRLLIQSNSGGGKSWAIRRLLEQSHGRVQQIVLDLEGEFNTLREKYDYILAGKGGDTPAQPKSAALLARRLLELRVSAICDLYELKAPDRVRFVRLFLESLVSAPKSLWHPVLVIVDEAHHFAPEKGQAESAPAVIDLITRGRKRGLCGILATQRLSKLHKDAAAELLNKMIGRTSLDIDRKRAADELGFRSSHESLMLRNLKPGSFHTYGPAIRVGKDYADGIVSIQVGSVKSRHPKVGDRQLEVPPAPTAKIRKVLAELEDLPAEAETQAQNVATLKKQVTDLRRKLTVAERTQTVQCNHAPGLAQLRERAATAEKLIKTAKDHTRRLEPSLKRVVDSVGAIQSDVARTLALMENGHKLQPTIKSNNRRPQSTSQSIITKIIEPRKVGNVSDVTAPQQRLIDCLAAFESIGLQPIHKSSLAARAGVSSRSGGYFNNLGRLRSLGLIKYPQSSYVELTEAGRQVANSTEAIESLGDLHESWLSMVSLPQAKIMVVLLGIYPDDIGKDELAERIGVSASSGGYFNNLGRLRTLRAAVYPSPGRIKASELLFPEGLT